MKVRATAVVLSSCVLGLAGCASHQEQAAYVEPATVGGASSGTQPVADPAPIVVDSDYVSKVERIALRRGIDVHWVNAPTARKRD